MRRMREERLRRGVSQKYVATQVGVTPELIHYIETGERNPSYPVLVKLEDLFGKSHRELFGAATPDNTGEPDGNQACKVNTHTE